MTTNLCDYRRPRRKRVVGPVNFPFYTGSVSGNFERWQMLQDFLTTTHGVVSGHTKESWDGRDDYDNVIG